MSNSGNNASYQSKYKKGAGSQRLRSGDTSDDDSDINTWGGQTPRTTLEAKTHTATTRAPLPKTADESGVAPLWEQTLLALQTAKAQGADIDIGSGASVTGGVSEHSVLPEFGDQIRGTRKTELHQKCHALDKTVTYSVVSVKPISRITFDALRIFRENLGKDRVIEVSFNPRAQELSFLARSTRVGHSAAVTCNIEKNMRERFLMNCVNLKRKTSACEFPDLLYGVVRGVATAWSEMPLAFGFTESYSPDDNTLSVTFTGLPQQFDLSFIEALHRKHVSHRPWITISGGADPALTILLKPQQGADTPVSGKKRK